jgi:hypothetical protein
MIRITSSNPEKIMSTEQSKKSPPFISPRLNACNDFKFSDAQSVDLEIATFLDQESAQGHMLRWVNRAIETASIDPDEALASAYEAGRYGLESPASLLRYPKLHQAFELGKIHSTGTTTESA